VSFQSGKSTATALLITTYNWLIINELEAGKEVCSVFFDIRKAFDSVPHRELVQKLCKLHINPIVLKWITSYLTMRYQKVVIGGEESETIPVTSGVPRAQSWALYYFSSTSIDDITRISLLKAQNWYSMPMICCFTGKLTTLRTM